MWCLFLPTLSYSVFITNSFDLLQRVWTPISSLQNVYFSESYVNIGIYFMLYIYMKVYSYWYLFGYMVFSFVMRVRILWYSTLLLYYVGQVMKSQHTSQPLLQTVQKNLDLQSSHTDYNLFKGELRKIGTFKYVIRCTQIYCCTHNLTFNTILVTNTYIIKQKF